MKFVSPSGNADSIVSNYVTVGAYYGIGINPNKISKDLLNKRKTKLENAYNAVCSNDMFGDDCLGELLYVTGMVYFYELNIFDDIFAKSDKVTDLRHVSESIVTKDVDVSSVWGMPLRTTEASFMIDVDRIIHATVAKDGDQSKERNFTISAGQVSSALENGIFKQLYQAQGISTVKLLKVASDQGIPIYTINQSNIASILPKLSISTDVTTDIQNMVNAGKTITVSGENVNYYGWIGVGYIVMDTQTGSGAYMISANLSGGGRCVTAAGGAGHHCALIYIEIIDALKVLAAIVVFPTVATAAIIGAVTEIGFAGIALAVGLSLLGIIIGAIIAVIVISIIIALIKTNTASNDDRRRKYALKRRTIWA